MPASSNVDQPPAELRRTQNGTAGPTDDSGSPLFVPTTAEAVQNGAEPASNGITSGEGLGATPPASQPSASTTNGTSSSQKQPDKQTPSLSDSWGFNGLNGEAASSNTNGEAVAHESTPEEGQGAEGPTSSSSGKGKGKAGEVEDAPDHES